TKSFKEARQWLLAVDPLNDIGMLAYGTSATNTVPKYRFYNGTGWSSQANANDVGGAINYVILKNSPTKYEEFILGTQDANADVNVQVYNGTGWSSVLEVTASVTGATLRGFDIEYEELSGQAIIAYSNGTRYLNYRVWNGTGWESEKMVPNTLNTGNIEWVELASRPGTDEIAAVWSDANDDLNAMIWNGTDWYCAPKSLLTTTLSTFDTKKFDVEYENSGDLFILFGIAGTADLSYTKKPADVCAFTTQTETTWVEIGDAIDISTKPGGDHIIAGIYDRGGSDTESGAWLGQYDQWGAINTVDGQGRDTTSQASTVNEMMVAVGWVGTSNTGVYVYSDSAATGIDWATYDSNTNMWTSQSDATVTPAFTTDKENIIMVSGGTVAEEVMLIVSDAGSNLWAKTFDGGSWSDTEGGASLGTVTTIDRPCFDFAYKRVAGSELLATDIKPMMNGAVVTGIEEGDNLQVNVTIMELNNSGISNVNVTLVIKDSSGNVVYSNTTYGLSFSASETKNVNFTGINTSGWANGYYNASAYVVWDGGSHLYYEDNCFKVSTLLVYPSYPAGQCLGANYTMNVTLINDWGSSITVNVSVYNYSDFKFSPNSTNVIVPAGGSNITSFNLTMPSVKSSYTLWVRVNYTDGNNIPKFRNYSLTFLVPGPLISITKESTEKGGDLKSVYPRLIIHNYGCGLAESIEVNETVSAGFSVFDVSNSGTTSQLPDYSTRIKWNIERLAIDEIQSLSYRLQMPSTDSEGTTSWDTEWSDEHYNSYSRSESSDYQIESDTSTNPHFEFNLTVVGSQSERVIQPNQTYVINLTVKNVGQAAATAGLWNITAVLKTREKDYVNQNWTLDYSCNVTDAGGGSWNQNTREIIWPLSQTLEEDSSTTFNFTINCTKDDTEINVFASAKSEDNPRFASYCDTTKYVQDATADRDFYHVFKKPADAPASAAITRFEVRAVSSTAGCARSTNWEATDCGYVRIYNDAESGYFIAWYGCDDQPAPSGSTFIKYDPTDFKKENYTTEPYKVLRITLNGTGRATGEMLCMNRICYDWNWTEDIQESQSLFLKVRKNSPPQIWNEALVADGDWGQPFNFSVDVYDANGDDVNVSLWLNLTTGWTYIGSQTCTQCNTTQKKYFIHNFTCADHDKTYQYKFVAEDPKYFLNETSSHSFTVEKNDLIFTVQSGNGSNAIANRTADMSNLTLSVNIRDENGSYVGGLNVTFFITMKGQGAQAVWDNPITYPDHYRQTDSEGNVSYNFTAALHCDDEGTPLVDEEYEVGPHNWYVEVNSTNECYKPLKSYEAPEYNDYYEFTTIDQLNNTIQTPKDGSTIQQGRQNVSILTYIYNYCQEPMEISTSNITFNLSTEGISYPCTPVEKVGANVYICNWETLNRTNGWYNFTMTSWATYYYNDTKTQENAFELQTVPLLKEADMSPHHDSWSKSHNFSVKVTDDLGDMVNVTLKVKVGSSETSYDLKCCGQGCAENPGNCSQTLLNWTNIVFPCSGYAGQTAFFWFEAVDTQGYSYSTSVGQGDYLNESEPNFFSIEKSDINLTYISGNFSTATPLQPATFVVRAYNIDNETWNFASGESPLVKFNVTKNFVFSSYALVNQTYANETGYASVTFTPDPSFENGNQYWNAYIDSLDMCFKEYNTTNYTVIITTEYPPLYANETAMNVLYGTGVQRGWGEGWTFNVTVKDPEGGDVNVSLQINSGSGWQVIENKTCTACADWTTINFSVNLTCDLVSSTAQFRFVLTDNATSPNTNTTAGHTINIEKDDVTFEVIWGHNNITNRSSDYINLSLIVRLKDENGSVLGEGINVSFNITKVGTGGGASWDAGRFRTTNSSGIANYSFFPTCDNPETPTENEEYETGNHDWFVKVSESEQCYKASQSATYNFSVIDTLTNVIDLPNGDENYTTENSILLQGFVKNFCDEPITTSESNVWFNLSNGAYTTNCSVITRVGANVYKCTWNPTQEAVYGYYNVTMRSIYENSYENITTKYPPETFYLFTRPKLRAANVTPRSDSWSVGHNFTVNVSDNLGDTVNVTLETQILGGSWSEVSTKSCTNCSDNPLGYTVFEWTDITYPCSGYATQWMKFRIRAVDTEGNTKYTDILNPGEYYNNDDTYYIEKSDVSLTYISGNFSLATLTQPAEFVVRAYDIERQNWSFNAGESPLVKFNVTKNFVFSSYALVNQTYANETGYASVTFTPDGTFANGNQSWNAYIDSSDTCFKTYNTTNYTVTVDVNYPPIYRNEMVNGLTQGASAGWGEIWNFSIEVKDLEGDDLNISLQIDTGSGYIILENKSCQNCGSWTQINFTESLDCGNISSNAYYKFVIVDNRSNSNATIPHSFTIEKDDINYTVIQGHQSIANRSGSQTDTLIVSVIDSDRNLSVGEGVNGTFWVTTNGIPNWDSGFNLTTDLGGNWTYNFNPTCASEGTQYEVGQQYWRFKTIGNVCYKNVDSFYDLSQTYTLTVKGQLNVTLIDPTETNFTEGQSVTFLGKLEDDCSDLKSGFPVKFIPWNGNYNETLVADSLGGGFYRYVWPTSGGKPGGWYNITMSATEAYSNTYYPDKKDYTFPNETSPLHAFYLEIYPRLKQADVTPRQEGWSVLRNFSVNVSDEEVDTVTVRLWERISGQDWTEIGESQMCSNCSNYTMKWNSTYDCSYAGKTMNFKFNATDNDNNAYTTSVINGDYVSNDDSFIIEKDDVEVLYGGGNESSVNRSAGYAVLSLFVNDTDSKQAASSPASTVRFNITTNGSWSEFLIYGYNTTNSTGYANFYFNPNCSFSVGKQYWKGFTDDSCYKTNFSGIFNVTVYGDIEIYADADNSTYYQEDTITVWVNVTDDCGTPINVTTINITLKYNESINYTCGNVVLYNTGNYSCNWTSTQQDPTGYYDVIVFATLPPYYNNETYTKENDFILFSYINNNPMLSNEAVFPEGWGTLTNFTVTVEDVDDNNVSVQLWEASSPEGPWTFVNEAVCWNCLTPQTLNFSKYHTCADAGQTRYYKFNATDGMGGTATTDSHSFVVEKDNVSVEVIQGNGAQANRSGEQYNSPAIIIRIFDSDNQTYVGENVNATLWVAHNGTNYAYASQNTTNSTGYAIFYFNPDCNHSIGPQYWTAGSLNNTCYEDKNITSTPTVTIIGDLVNNITNITCPSGWVCYDNENVTIRGTASDECGNPINSATVNFTVSHGTFQANCIPVNNETNGYYNCSWDVTGSPGGIYVVNMSSSGQYLNNGTFSNTSGFFHQIKPYLFNATVTPLSAPYGANASKSQFTFKVNVSDDDDNTTVQLWESFNSPSGPWTLVSSQPCNDCLNTTVTFTRMYTSCSNIGNWYWKINVSDSFGYNDTTSGSDYVTVTKRNVTFIPIEGNNSNVSRVGMNSTLLKMQVYDEYTNSPLTGSGRYAYFWVTTNSTSMEWGPGMYDPTDSNGIFEKYFDPNCTGPKYHVMPQKWKGGINFTQAGGMICYYDTNSSEYDINITSVLYANVTYPVGNKSFQFGTDIPLWTNVWDDCDAYVPNVDVRIRVWSGANEFIPTPDPAYNIGNGSYNSTWNSSESGLGRHNVTVNATKDLYEQGYDIEVDAFTLAEAPILSNPWVDQPNEGWGYNFTFKILFQDLDDDDVVNVSFWISNSTSGPWTLVESKNGSGGAGQYNLTFMKSFDCNQYKIGPALYFKFTAVDIYNLTAESSVSSTILEKDNVSLITIAGANSYVNREGSDTENLIILVNDTDAGIPVGSGVNGTFWIQYNYMNFDSGHNVTTNSSGYMNYTFNPDCSYMNGSQYWYAEVAYDECYDDEQMASWETINILGQLKLLLDQPPQGSVFNVTDSIFLNFTVYTDCSNEGNVSGADTSVYFFNGATQKGCSQGPYDEGNGVYNCTLNTTGLPEGYWSINITAEKDTFNLNNTVWPNRFWLENKEPVASGATASPTSDGWGARYTYNITINDPENDTVMCTLYTNTTGSGWVERGYSIVSNGQGNCSIQVQSFVSDDMGPTQYRFKINDTFNSFETDNFTGPTLGEDDVTITFVYGNYTGGQEGLVNRSGNQNATLIVFVNDTDRGSPPSGVNVTFYVMYNSTDWDNGNLTFTNGTGYSSYYFNPNCLYSVGERLWFAGVRDSRYVDQNTSSNYTVLIRGDLVNRIQLPNGTEHLRGTNVTIRANVTDEDECGNMIEGVDVTFQMTNVNGSVYSCTPVIDEGNGWYNCTFNTTGMPPRMYNITMNSSKQYYNNRTITIQYVAGQTSFWIETSPILWQNTVTITPTVGGWSEAFTFNVTVMDEDLDTVTVNAYFRQETPTQGSWQPFGSVQNSGINWTANFTKESFGPGYVNKILSVIFNATEDDQWYFVTEPVNFTVERNDVNFTYIAGNETTVNRVGNDNVTFIIYVYDEDNPSHPPVTNNPGMFWVTTNASDPNSWDSGTARTSNATGYLNYNFNPDGSCTYGVGKQRWKAGIVEGSTYYKPKNYTEFNVTITSEFIPALISPHNQSFLK
ncbi:MAG: hypothetical protein QXN01_04305, partial [Candidatus Anstonellales archaeon]